jgi:hypothetical protein
MVSTEKVGGRYPEIVDAIFVGIRGEKSPTIKRRDMLTVKIINVRAYVAERSE